MLRCKKVAFSNLIRKNLENLDSRKKVPETIPLTRVLPRHNIMRPVGRN